MSNENSPNSTISTNSTKESFFESMPTQSIGRPKGWDKFVEGVIVVEI